MCLQLNVRPDIQLFLEDSILSFPGGHFSFVGNISPDFAFPSSSRDSIRLSKPNSLSTQPTFFRIDSTINSIHKITTTHSFILRNQSTELQSTKRPFNLFDDTRQNKQTHNNKAICCPPRAVNEIFLPTHNQQAFYQPWLHSFVSLALTLDSVHSGLSVQRRCNCLLSHSFLYDNLSILQVEFSQPRHHG